MSVVCAPMDIVVEEETTTPDMKRTELVPSTFELQLDVERIMEEQKTSVFETAVSQRYTEIRKFAGFTFVKVKAALYGTGDQGELTFVLPRGRLGMGWWRSHHCPAPAGARKFGSCILTAPFPCFYDAIHAFTSDVYHRLVESAVEENVKNPADTVDRCQMKLVKLLQKTLEPLPEPPTSKDRNYQRRKKKELYTGLDLFRDPEWTPQILGRPTLDHIGVEQYIIPANASIDTMDSTEYIPGVNIGWKRWLHPLVDSTRMDSRCNGRAWLNIGGTVQLPRLTRLSEISLLCAIRAGLIEFMVALRNCNAPACYRISVFSVPVALKIGLALVADSQTAFYSETWLALCFSCALVLVNAVELRDCRLFEWRGKELWFTNYCSKVIAQTVARYWGRYSITSAAVDGMMFYILRNFGWAILPLQNPLNEALMDPKFRATVSQKLDHVSPPYVKKMMKNRDWCEEWSNGLRGSVDWLEDQVLDGALFSGSIYRDLDHWTNMVTGELKDQVAHIQTQILEFIEFSTAQTPPRV